MIINMKYNFKVFALLLVVGVLLAGFVYFVSAQFGNEITALYLFDVAPAGNSTCVTSGPSCLDTDGGYFPATQGSMNAAVNPMQSAVAGGNVFWGPTLSSWQCVAGSELCNPNNGRLLEAVCGSAIGIPNGAAFNAAFPGNFWTTGGEPAALIEVDCAIYAANNPSLGLQGVCSAGACV